MASVSIDTSRFRARYQKYVEQVRERLETSWEEVLLACLEDISTRTPSPEEELAYVNGIQGGTFYEGSPTKDNPERISFLRSPGMWLADLVKFPSTYTTLPGELKLNLGIVSGLEGGSTFSWQNVYKGEPVVHWSGERGYSLWGLFEYGKYTVQKAAYPPGSGANGAPAAYKLKPGDGMAYWLSTKQYPRKAMYTDFNYSVFRNKVLEIARSVQF